ALLVPPAVTASTICGTSSRFEPRYLITPRTLHRPHAIAAPLPARAHCRPMATQAAVPVKRRAAPRPLHLLLVLGGVAPRAERLHWGALAVFLCSALAIVPLAGLMGEATEQLASRLGSGVGGLLNATFGNAAELIIALAALRLGLFDVVKASLTGSIIGNIL